VASLEVIFTSKERTMEHRAVQGQPRHPLLVPDENGKESASSSSLQNINATKPIIIINCRNQTVQKCLKFSDSLTFCTWKYQIMTYTVVQRYITVTLFEMTL
jgi:hypothetical protein